MTSQTDRISAALAGRYRIERHLGEGGMATVYLAEDLKHKRRVALKVLKPELAAVLGADRFIQEITTTAALQHPHILPLFDSGNADGFLYYVMPFIDGETLRTKLDRERQLSVTEAVRIAREVADGLDYAHRHGVVHRDIKPENILLHDGRPMVADFGIALAVSAAAGGRMTETGLSLGTPHYMSPEQATAEKDISARSDVYSLASVLFEMLAGQPPHLGGSAQQIIMKIITAPAPSVTVLRKSVPPNVAAAIAKALEKLPADRFESAKAFAEALGNPAYTNPSGDPVAGFATAGRSGLPVHVFVATCLIAIAATAAATWWIAARNADAPVAVHFAFPPGLSGPTRTDLALSPDGGTVVYSARDSARLFVRPLNDLRQQAIAGTEGAQAPFFSPDGRSIGFNVGRQLKKVPVEGGTATTLAELDVRRGASWGPDGILVSSEDRLVLVPSDGGTPVPLVRGDSTRGYWPVLLPGGKAVVYSTAAGVDAPLAVMILSTGRSTHLGLSGVTVGVAGGALIFVRSNGDLMAVPFDAGARRVTGDARVVVADLRRDANTGATAVALSAEGTLAYITGSEILQAVVVNLQGAARVLPIPPGRIDNVRYSRDGRRVAADVNRGGRRDIYIYDVGSGAEQRVTAEGTRNIRPAWNLDGTRILYQTNRGGNSTLWWQPADGSGAAEQLMASLGKEIWEGELTPDSKSVVYRTGLVPADIVYRHLKGDTAEKGIATTQFNEYAPRLSPDGHWVAYVSNESGADQVYVRPFPGPGAQFPVSVTGGTNPVWSRDGGKIFFVNERQLVAASVVTSPLFSVTARDTLFEGNYRTGFRHAGYDVAPDGKSFLMLRPVGNYTEQIVVIHNWAAELQASRKGASPR